MEKASYSPRTDLSDLPSEARVLVLAADSPGPIAAKEARQARVPAPVMPAGRYEFRAPGVLDVLVCIAGHAPVQPVTSTDVDSRDALSNAREWFGSLWAGAAPLAGVSDYSAADRVRVIGDSRPWTIDEVRPSGDSYRYDLVHGGDRLTSVSAESIEAPFAETDTPLGWLRRPPVDAKRSSIALTLTKLRNPLTDVVYSHLASRTVFRAYQFRPVLKLVASSRSGLLIADEVGLGKTIEAGLIWTELDARSGADLERVLVVCPASLIPKWRSEMSERFGRRLVEIDSEQLAQLAADAEAGEPGVPLHAVASIERLRISDDMKRLTQFGARFDLVILDEAHVVRNPGTKSHDLGGMLETLAETLILLSATPLNLRQRDLFSLVELIDPATFYSAELFPRQLEPNAVVNRAMSRLFDLRETPEDLLEILQEVETVDFGATVSTRSEYGDLCELLSDRDRLDDRDIAHAMRLFGELNVLASVVTRTRKVDVPEDKVIREPIDVAVQVTADEEAAYEAVRAWALARANELDQPVAFVAQMPLRQAASCMQVFARGDWRTKGTEAELLLANGDYDFDADALEILDDVPAAKEWAELDEALRRLGDVDSKLDSLLEILDDDRLAERPVLLFSFFKGTLRYLEDQLGGRWRVARLDGDVKQPDRQRIMTDFRLGKYDILLASEVASEGLDFEFAGVLINYDLPWNPMRVEQRIGRLDRFGQTHEKILIVNFHQPGTIETEIMTRLYRRISLFHDSVGELEQILADTSDEMMQIAFDLELSPKERQRRTEEKAAAIEAKRVDLESLDQAGQVAALDNLLVEGLEKAINERGRFIGNRELVPLLGAFLGDGAHGTLSFSSPDEIAVIGDLTIAERVSRALDKQSRGQRPGLIPGLRAGDPLPLTLSNEDRRASIDLLSHRHPLVRAAVEHFGPRDPDRFGELAIHGAKDGVYLVLVWVVEIRGARQELELWSTGVNLRTGDIDTSVGDRMLQAITHNEIFDPDSAHPTDGLEQAYINLRSDLENRQSLEERDRRRRNEQLVDSFVATERGLTDARARRLSEQMARTGVDGRIRRMKEGQIRNIQADADRKIAELEKRRGLSVGPAEAGIFIVHELSQSVSKGLA